MAQANEAVLLTFKFEGEGRFFSVFRSSSCLLFVGHLWLKGINLYHTPN